MTTETFQITNPIRVFGFGEDGTARFFVLPSQAVINVVDVCAFSGRVQIAYDQRFYVTFERNLISRLRRGRDLTNL